MPFYTIISPEINSHESYSLIVSQDFALESPLHFHINVRVIQHFLKSQLGTIFIY